MVADVAKCERNITLYSFFVFSSSILLLRFSDQSSLVVLALLCVIFYGNDFVLGSKSVC